MRVANLGGVVVGVVLMSVTAGCGGSPERSSAPSGDSSRKPAGPPSVSPSTGPTLAGVVVTEGPATFTLSDGVDFVEAPSETPGPATKVRKWTWAPAGKLTQCFVGVNVQGGFKGDFPAAQQVIFKARIEAQGGEVLVNDAEPGPEGTRAGLLQHETTPNLGKNRDTTVSTWSRSYVTPGGTYVEVAATSGLLTEATCQVEAMVKSLGWTGQEAAGPGAGGG